MAGKKIPVFLLKCRVGVGDQQPEKSATVRKLEATPQLEWTLFMNGIFTNYFAGSRNKSHLKKFSLFVNPDEHKGVDIPGDGNDPLVFTRVEDVAKFVVASLSLDNWPRELGMVGSVSSYNEVISILEKTQG
jgi:hypothetical protein